MCGAAVVAFPVAPGHGPVAVASQGVVAVVVAVPVAVVSVVAVAVVAVGHSVVDQRSVLVLAELRDQLGLQS